MTHDPSDPFGLNEAEQAYSVHVFFCENPQCLRPHVALGRKDGKVFAHFVLPDKGFIDKLLDAEHKSLQARGLVP